MITYICKTYNKTLYAVISSVLLFACATTPPSGKPPLPTPAPPAVEKLPLAEQEQKSLEVFEQILEMTAEAERTAILPQMETAYYKIINEYPDSSIAHESYWRLIIMSLDDYTPPKIQQAEKLYRDFIQNYPDSPYKWAIEDTLVRFFHRNYLWDKVIEFTTPTVREYLKTGTIKGPFYLFLYSEAKLNLGDLTQAERGYKIIRELFPSSTEALISKDRLDEIKLKRR